MHSVIQELCASNCPSLFKHPEERCMNIFNSFDMNIHLRLFDENDSNSFEKDKVVDSKTSLVICLNSMI